MECFKSREQCAEASSRARLAWLKTRTAEEQQWEKCGARLLGCLLFSEALRLPRGPSETNERGRERSQNVFFEGAYFAMPSLALPFVHPEDKIYWLLDSGAGLLKWGATDPVSSVYRASLVTSIASSCLVGAGQAVRIGRTRFQRAQAGSSP